MQWQWMFLAIGILRLLNTAGAKLGYGQQAADRATSHHEPIVFTKRQTPVCEVGYFQCPLEFGGGCCPEGRVSSDIHELCMPHHRSANQSERCVC